MDRLTLPEHSYPLALQALENSGVGTWYWDIPSGRHHWSARCRSLLALPADREPSLEHFYAALHPEDRNAVEQRFASTLRERVESFRIECRILHGQAEARWLCAAATLQRDDAGNPVAMSIVLSDLAGGAGPAPQRTEELAALERRERWLRMALEATLETVWIWRLDSGEIDFAPGFPPTLGYPPEDHRQHLDRWVAIMHPDDAETLIDRAMLQLRSTGQFDLEYRVRHADGNYLWVQSKAKVTERGPAGEPLQAIGTLSDITERKHFDAMLWEALTHFHAVYAHASLGIAILGETGEIQECNPTFEALVGHAESALVKITLADLVLPDFHEALATGLRGLLAGELERFSSDLRYRHREGHPIDVNQGVTCLADKQGQSTRLIVLVTDLTERKRAEAEARESQYMLELALAGSELGIWDHDVASGRNRYDQRYCAMLGYQPGEIEPTLAGWQRLIHPDDLERVNRDMHAYLCGERRLYESEFRMLHKDGHWVWVQTRGKALRGPRGEPVRMTGTHLDISERKQITTEGRQILAQIEALIHGLERQPGTGQESVRVAAAHSAPLSKRNREVLTLIASGLTSVQIAERLGITNQTAMTHRRNLMRKLGLKNKAELIRYALQNRLIEP